MKIAFLENSLGLRGTTVALHDYAHYAETLLGHEAVVLTRPHEAGAGHCDKSPDVYLKFEARFPVRYFRDPAEVPRILEEERADVLYIIKYGLLDGVYDSFQNIKTLMHCVFDPRQPHGDLFCVISPWLNVAFGTQLPVLPHIVSLPDEAGDLRETLGIPRDAVVFGRHGGYEEFDVPAARTAVATLASSYPDRFYFVFMNTAAFLPPSPNVIFLPASTDPSRKAKFINTCDAMLYGRARGETFGLAIAEFSVRNKPVFAPCFAPEQMHRVVLQNRAYWYQSTDDLIQKMLAFDPAEARKQDWNAYRDYAPEKVMPLFQQCLERLVKEKI